MDLRCIGSAQEQFYRFARISARVLHAVALTGDIQLRAKGNKAVVLRFDDRCKLSDHCLSLLSLTLVIVSQPMATVTGSLLQEPIPHRPPAHALRSRQYRVHVEAVVTVQLGQRAGLAEVLHAQRAHAVAAYAAQP